MIRLLHLADLHPQNAGVFAGKTVIDPATGLNQALTDLENSLDFVIEVALERECHAALLAGDLFDSSRPHQNEVRVIREAVGRLAMRMPVLMIPGNHDMSQNPEDATALECLKGLPNVWLYEAPNQIDLILNGSKVRFFFLPYPTRGRLLSGQEYAHLGPEELTALINHLLASAIGQMVMNRSEGLNVFLGHGSVGTAKVGQQPRSLAQDILLPLDLLTQFDYAALGHIHAWQMLSETVAYSGSLMRADFGEADDLKGFNLIDLHPHQPTKIDHLENPHARRYVTLSVQDLQQMTQHDPGTVYRVKDQLIPEDYDDMRGVIQAFAEQVPFFQDSVEIVTEARSRDAGMAECLTMDAALTRALTGKVDEKDLPAVLEKHRGLLLEVGQ